MELNENSRKVLEKRYLIKNDKGEVIETPEALFRRVAHAVASAEKTNKREWEDKFYVIMENLEFLPNSPTLMNAGRDLGQLSGCFTLPIEDNMRSIFTTLLNTALIHQSGGGTGFNFSNLRPRGSRVRSTSGVASGPVSFMRVYNASTEEIKQGGTRRGANMGILNCNHPDILEFITCKKDNKTLNNFNISVAVTDEFMECLELDEEYSLINPNEDEPIIGRTQALHATQVLNEICKMAWKNGDPGLIFIDEINRYNPTPQLGWIESTNPCGEQPLLPYESCNLGSLNLSKFLNISKEWPGFLYAQLKSGDLDLESNTIKPLPKTRYVNWKKLEEITKLAVRFLDNIIDINKFPLPEIKEATLRTRKIGLGIMGWADMLILLGIPYNSEEAIVLAEEIMSNINKWALEESQNLAIEKGPYPATKTLEIGTTSPNDKPIERNAARTTIAPTGSLSVIANCSSGIEPLFALEFERHQADMVMFDVNKYLKKILEERGADIKINEITHTIILPDDLKRVFVTAQEIEPIWHIKMQEAFQKHTNNAVSKTINLPYSATVQEVKEIYIEAWKRHLKGITVYRDGSREEQVFTTQTSTTKKKPIQREEVTIGETVKIPTGCGSMYLTINRSLSTNKLQEVFARIGKAGGCETAQLEGICRLVSLSLRSGIEPKYVVKQLKGIRCPKIAWARTGKSCLSCSDGIAQKIEEIMDEKLEIEPPKKKNTIGECPECHDLLVNQEGCNKCLSCGYTKC